MDYIEQLEQPEWKDKRIEILNRDENRCQVCMNESFTKSQEKAIAFGSTLQKHRGDKYSIGVFGNEVKGVRLSIGAISTTANLIAYIIPMENSWISRWSIIALREMVDHVEREDIYDSSNSSNLEMRPFSSRAFSELHREFNNSFSWLFIRGLNIHHKYYQEGRLAWQYPNEALVTLCWQCHEKIHEGQKIPWLDYEGNEVGMLTPCTRCLGAGYIPRYSHVENGVCFKCNGGRFEEIMN